MKTKNVALFSYDFPHKKTQDFIFRLFVEGFNIRYIIAAPRVKLNIKPASIRIAPENMSCIHPRQICKALKIKYLVCEHNSVKTINYIKNNPVDLYIVSGARILSSEVIETTNKRTVNIHPGLIPEARGLDTLLWSIYYDVPIGITSHFIGSKIDSGLLIKKEKLLVKRDDTLIDISLRLLEKQTDVLIETLKVIKTTPPGQFPNLDLEKTRYNTKMEPKLEEICVKKFPSWLRKFSV